MARLHAVARGDIVHSSQLPHDRRRRLPNRLRTAYDHARSDAPDALPYGLAIIGGDGWQCYLEDPSAALARVLHFWALLASQNLRSRFAIAVGTVDFIPNGNVNEGDGAAFRTSGQGLEMLGEDQWVSIRLPESVPVFATYAAETMAELVDHFAHEWTEAQAQAVAGMLRGIGTDRSITQQSIADAWTPEPITRQSVNRHLQRAFWPRLQRTLSRYQRLVTALTK